MNSPIEFFTNLTSTLLDNDDNIDLSDFVSSKLCPKEIEKAIKEGETTKSLLHLVGIIAYKNLGISSLISRENRIIK